MYCHALRLPAVLPVYTSSGPCRVFPEFRWVLACSRSLVKAVGLAVSPLGCLDNALVACMQPQLGDLEAFDPDAAASLLQVRQLSSADYVAMLELEGLPADTTPHAYQQHAVRQLLVEQANWQAAAFAQVILL